MSTATRIRVAVVLGVLCASAEALQAQDWPQFRGPNRDARVEGFKAPATWPKELTRRWTAEVGAGQSSPVLVGDRLYAFGRQGDQEVTTCLDAASGKVIWQDKYEAAPVTGAATGRKREYIGTRSTPAVAEGKVCTLGVAGVVSCLDAATGKVVWRKDTGSRPQFFTSTSPLIADGKCLVYVGALTAFDLTTGAPAWEWAGGKTPYGSPVLMTVGGTKQVVTSAYGSIVGVRWDDGQLLWRFEFGGNSWQGAYMTPVIDGQTVIYSNPGGRGSRPGTVAFKVEKKGDGFAATELWRKDFSPYQYNTPVLRDGLLFGLSTDRHFFCLDARTGDLLWTDDTTHGEAGGVLDAGGVILALTGDSELIAFEPSRQGYRELARYRVSPTQGLAYPVVAGNRVFVHGDDAVTLWTLD